MDVKFNERMADEFMANQYPKTFLMKPHTMTSVQRVKWARRLIANLVESIECRAAIIDYAEPILYGKLLTSIFDKKDRAKVQQFIDELQER